MKTLWRMNWLVLVVLFSLGFVLPSFSTETRELKIEGMIDIDYPQASEAKVEVNLEGNLLNLAAKAVVEKNPEASSFLSGLQTIRVRIYSNVALGKDDASQSLKFYQDQLQEPKWSVIARVKDKESTVGVYSLIKGDYIAGLVVLVGNPKELIVVNLAGKIDPAKLAKLSQFPQLGNLGEIAKVASEMSKKQPDFTIKGVVKDAKSGKPIEGAKVSDGEYGPEPRKSATTDSEGNYSYATWYEEHFIFAEAPGYKTQRIILTTELRRKVNEAEFNFELVPE